MKTMKWTLLLAFFAIWACQEEQFSQEEVWKDSSSPSPRVERLRTIKRVDNAPATRAVGVKDKLWQPGDTIRIKFQNADEYPGMSDKVIQYAAIWLQYAYLHFEYVDKEEEADVKIGFNMDDRWLSWSTLGTDCKSIDQDSVSANFVWLENDDEETIQGEVLRTFGHILGLGFEHQSPASPITLNDVKTIDYYIDNFNLTDSTIINDILPYYNSDQTNYTEFDDESIMTLELPGRQIQERPYYNLYFNYTLSPTDISFVRDSLYPYTVDPDPADSCIAIINIHETSAVIYATVSSDIEIDWGNGQKSVITAEESKFNPKGVDMYYGGIDDFTIKIYGSNTSISDLYIICLNVSNLDISKNKNLKRLECSRCNLFSLNVSQNTNLKVLSCNDNNLTQLDLSNNKELEDLFCEKNNITNINLKENNKLRYISINNNNLTTLSIENLLDLETLDAKENKLTSIDVHSNLNLNSLYLSYNHIEKIDVSNNRKLISLHLDDNMISQIDVSNNIELWVLHCNKNNLTTLNITGLNYLVELEFNYNPISYEETKFICKSINDRTPTSNGRILFPVYCYKNSLSSCGDQNHQICNREKISLELASLIKTKNWVLTRGRSAYTPYQHLNKLDNQIYFKRFYKNQLLQ